MSVEAAAFLRARLHPLRLVIFDCDGVLIDSEAPANRIAAAMLAEAGWVMTETQAEERFIGLSFSVVQAMAEAHLGRPLGADWVSRVVDRVIEAMRLEATLIPGAREAVDAVTALGLPWRIASNSSHAEMEAKFGRVGWTALVAGRVHSASDVIALGGLGKPAPDVFLAAAAAEGIEPVNCLVIEDSAAGATAAHAAGMDCLGLAPRGDDPRLRAAGAVLFRSMKDLPALLPEAPR